MELWLVVAAFLITTDIILISQLMIKRLKKKEQLDTASKSTGRLIEYACGLAEAREKKELPGTDYYTMKQVVILDQTKQQNIDKSIDIEKVERKGIKSLDSRQKIVRLEAIVSLGLLATDRARIALEKAIVSEKDYTVKLYIANELSDSGNSLSIPVLTSTLINSHRFYRNKVNMLIVEFGDSFDSFLPLIAGSRHIELTELITDFASVYYSENTKNFLIQLINNREAKMRRLPEFYHEGRRCCANCNHQSLVHDRYSCPYRGEVEADYFCRRYKVLPVSIRPEESYLRLVYKACDILAAYYPEVIDQEEYYNSEDNQIKNYAIKALSKLSTGDRLPKLIAFLGDEATSRTAVNAISIIIENNPRELYKVAEAFYQEKEITKKKNLAAILSGRIEYYLLKMDRKNKSEAAGIIREILLLGRTSEIIDFLNKNKNIDLENEILEIIREVITTEETLKKDFTKYLNDRLKRKLNLERFEEPVKLTPVKNDKKLNLTLYSVLLFSILMTPAIYLIRYRDNLVQISLKEHLIRFVIDFNYYLAFYSMAINLIYLILLLFSYRHAKRQEKLWKLKNMSLLFKKRILPSVSIIAPAYNEEKTIIESANSLLNLKYPDYELLIVNDGSKDNTLDNLIHYYNLKRVDYLFDYRLKTKPVRGVYMNRSLPKLIVVDKDNGGKADSLNAGINISGKEYFCGIDADSLLEEEALLRLASLTLDEGIETPAMGGNVLPINGCEVEQGQIKKFRIPDNRLARLQTIEYLRAFMAGRMGWAKLNCLLIISGAFGLFRKERVVSVGGYLTSSGKYEKDTVGEDMELVVRISRLMRELGFRYKIRYAYNANCWTEVPEQIKIMKKQRYRWHKGLIDILTFHAKMIFNPRYGRTGMIAMPYFFFFEMIGPMLEFQGYVMVVLACLFGLLNAEMLLILFVCTILFGIMISLASLVIAERDMRSFSLKNVLTLVGYAFIENFGPRQFISFWRVGAFFQMFKNPGGWDKAERKGFQSNSLT
jgi:cellulose synthase/poly-beta-1,6-N-acetylglucosamine synthase-like glycosyltransferase